MRTIGASIGVPTGGRLRNATCPSFGSSGHGVIFIALATFGTASAIISADKSGNFWKDLTTIGREVEPLWIGAAILAYTLTEGATVIADTLRKKQYDAGMAAGEAKGRTEGRAEGRTEGRAEGRTEGRAEGRTETNESWMEMLDAYPDKTAAEIRRMVERGELPPAPGSRNGS